jgi:hypothetical protein
MMKMSADMEADIQAAEDRAVSLKGPLLIGDGSRKRGEVADHSAAACHLGWC